MFGKGVVAQVALAGESDAADGADSLSAVPGSVFAASDPVGQILATAGLGAEGSVTVQTCRMRECLVLFRSQ